MAETRGAHSVGEALVAGRSHLWMRALEERLRQQRTPEEKSIPEYLTQQPTLHLDQIFYLLGPHFSNR
jgi:hypothetical protein